MTSFVIQLNKQLADTSNGYTQWHPALQAVAYEIQALNNFVGLLGVNPDTGEDAFPRPITCNPSAVYQEEVTDLDGNTITQWAGVQEQVIGDANTIPTEDGMVTIILANYDWINFRFLPEMPTTFSIIGVIPPHSGRFI